MCRQFRSSLQVAEQLYRKKKLSWLLHPRGICIIVGLPHLCTFGLSLQLILQWSMGILVLILCKLERKRFSVEINAKLGSSFSLLPFVVVVASCTVLAMVATLQLAQLFFFHVLLIKKGISTFDYIMALRENDQPSVDHQSPQTTSVSSFTGLSTTSSFNALHRGWCTPPRLFLENQQYDVVPQEINMPVNSAVKMMIPEEPARKRNAGPVKFSPWTLARMNAEEVSKAVAEARKKSRILQPAVRSKKSLGKEIGRNSFGRPDNLSRANKRGKLPMDLHLEPQARISASPIDITDSGIVPSTSLAPLQLEARRAFRPRKDIFSTAVSVYSPSSLHSPEFLPFRISYSGAQESPFLPDVPSTSAAPHNGIQFFGSTSDSFDASGGEDNDMVPFKIVHRSPNWA